MTRFTLALGAGVTLGCAGLGSVPDTGHCTASEIAYFSCPTDEGALSVCGGPGSLQYRSGPIGSPSLSIPDGSDPAAFVDEVREYPQSVVQIVSISRGGRTYEIHDEVDGGGGDMGTQPGDTDQSWQGVLITSDAQPGADKKTCVAPAVTDWDGLKTLLSGP